MAGFFTTDQGLGKEYNNPGSQAKQPLSRPQVGDSLSATGLLTAPFGGGAYGNDNRNPYYSQVNGGGAGGVDTGGFSGGGGFAGGGVFNPVGLPTAPTQGLPPSLSSGLGDGGGQFVTGGNFTPTAADYQDYLGNRGLYQAGMSFLPFGGLLHKGMDYNYGLNTTGVGPTFTDRYTMLGAPGSSGEYTGGMMTPSQQRDMLIEQVSFDPEFSGMFDLSFLGYDPDLDLSLGPWTETTPLTTEQLAEMEANSLPNQWASSSDTSSSSDDSGDYSWGGFDDGTDESDAASADAGEW